MLLIIYVCNKNKIMTKNIYQFRFYTITDKSCINTITLTDF